MVHEMRWNVSHYELTVSVARYFRISSLSVTVCKYQMLRKYIKLAGMKNRSGVLFVAYDFINIYDYLKTLFCGLFSLTITVHIRVPNRTGIPITDLGGDGNQLISMVLNMLRKERPLIKAKALCKELLPKSKAGSHALKEVP